MHRNSRTETHRRDALNGNGPTVETGSRVALRGCGYCRVWFGLTSLQKGSRPKRKKKSNSAISPTGKYEVGNAALSLNGGGPLLVPG